MAQVHDVVLRACDGTTKDAPEERGRRHEKSMLAKVKDKAKRLKRRLSRKKSSAGDGLEEKGVVGDCQGRTQTLTVEDSILPPVSHDEVVPMPERTPCNGEASFPKEPQVTAEKHVLPAGDPLTPCEIAAEVKDEEAETEDKGFSVKEYLLQKLEPGDEDKVLSELITAAMSPRKQKLNEAIASLFYTPASSSAMSSPLPPDPL